MRDRTNKNKRTDEATRTVARIARLPRGFGFEALARLIEIQIRNPEVPMECQVNNPKVGSRHKSCALLWPTGANMRSKEIVLAVLVKGHRIDPVQVWAYQTLATLKTVLKSNESRVPLWRQAWEATAKKKDQTRHRGLGSQRRQSAQATWVVMGERARGENSRRRKIAHHPSVQRALETQNSPCGA